MLRSFVCSLPWWTGTRAGLKLALMPNSCCFALFQLELNVATPDALPAWSCRRCHWASPPILGQIWHYRCIVMSHGVSGRSEQFRHLLYHSTMGSYQHTKFIFMWLRIRYLELSHLRNYWSDPPSHLQNWTQRILIIFQGWTAYVE